jgi:uncharacterized protein involved in exopolysaccharide biosynthesis
VREQGLKLATIQTVLESRVGAMARSVRRCAANYAALEAEASGRMLALQQQLAEAAQRHQADMQRVHASKASETAAVQSELATLRQQLARAEEEHRDFCARQHHAHQGIVGRC